MEGAVLYIPREDNAGEGYEPGDGVLNARQKRTLKYCFLILSGTMTFVLSGGQVCFRALRRVSGEPWA